MFKDCTITIEAAIRFDEIIDKPDFGVLIDLDVATSTKQGRSGDC